MACGEAIRRRCSRLLVLCCVWVLATQRAVGVLMSLPPSGTKCVSEEIQPNVVVLANYAIIYEETPHHDVPTISAKVTSPFGSTLYHKEGVTTGTFAFTTTEAGDYLACFSVDNANKGSDTTMSIDWKIGISAKDWDSVAKKEKIEGVELELTKLEAVVDDIHDNLLYLKTREAEMREVSEKTNSRVAWYSIMSLGVCIVVSFLQLWHLKSFFHKKKLI